MEIFYFIYIWFCMGNILAPAKQQRQQNTTGNITALSPGHTLDIGNKVNGHLNMVQVILNDIIQNF